MATDREMYEIKHRSYGDARPGAYGGTFIARPAPASLNVRQAAGRALPQDFGNHKVTGKLAEYVTDDNDNNEHEIAELTEEETEIEIVEEEAGATMKRKRMLYGIASVVLLLLIVGVLVGVLVGTQSNKSDTTSTTAPTVTQTGTPSLSPTPKPTPIRTPRPTPQPILPNMTVAAFLPAATIDTIARDHTSPQAKSLIWLQDHPHLHSNNMTESRKLQLMGLVSLYYSTDGYLVWSDWAKKSWLRYDIHECEWGGISACHGTENGQMITDINFNRETTWQGTGGLRGTIPPELFFLTDLYSILFSGSSVSGSIPTQVGLLTDLGALRATGNDLTGSLPSELGALTGLRTLDLYQNALTGTIPELLLSADPQLTNLGLALNRFSGPMPTELGSLTSMPSLDLSSNQFTGTIPTQFGFLTGITYLLLNGNPLRGPMPSELGKLTRLLEVDISSTALNGTLPTQFGELTAIESMKIIWNQLSGPIPSELGQISSLDVLWLDHNKLTGTITEEVAAIPAIIDLRLDHNELTGTIPLFANRWLDVLRLNNNNLTGSIPESLSNMICEFIFLQDNQLYGSIPNDACVSGSGTITLDCDRVTCGCHDRCKCG